jgi:hypothetical protein
MGGFVAHYSIGLSGYQEIRVKDTRHQDIRKAQKGKITKPDSLISGYPLPDNLISG